VNQCISQTHLKWEYSDNGKKQANTKGKLDIQSRLSNGDVIQKDLVEIYLQEDQEIEIVITIRDYSLLQRNQSLVINSNIPTPGLQLVEKPNDPIKQKGELTLKYKVKEAKKGEIRLELLIKKKEKHILATALPTIIRYTIKKPQKEPSTTQDSLITPPKPTQDKPKPKSEKRDSLDWVKINKDSLQELFDYYHHHSQGMYSKEAKRKIRGFDQEYWNKIDKKEVKGLKQYRAKFTVSPYTPLHLDSVTIYLEKLNTPLEADELDWDKAVATHSVIGYQKYLDRYPQSPHKTQAQKAICKLLPVRALTTRNTSTFFLHIQKPPYCTTTYTYRIIEEKGVESHWEKPNEKLVITILDKEKHTLILYNQWGGSSSFELDVTTAPLQAKHNFIDEGLYIEILGGTPPYIARLFPEGAHFYDKVISLQAKNTISNEQLRGVGKIEIFDKRLTESVSISHETQGNTSFSLPYYFWLLLILLIGGTGFWVYSRRKAAQNERLRKAFLAKHKNPTPQTSPQAPKTEETHKHTIKKKSIHHHASDTHDNKHELPTNPLTSYHPFPLGNHWEDSAIHTVYIHHECVEAISQFIQEENSPMEDENSKDIPEIGGFLLGAKEWRDDTQQYQVFITQFVPITPEMNNVYQIEFGTQAWLKLTLVQEEYPTLKIIGWFHTHPGHGLFLSKPDLKIHEGFFQEPYTLAMEIDTLSKGLDTAFFTRTQEGIINNTPNKKALTQWFKWEDLL